MAGWSATRARVGCGVNLRRPWRVAGSVLDNLTSDPTTVLPQ